MSLRLDKYDLPARKAKRWRPRLSVRTLAILITLVCCYAACWGPTKKSGVDDLKNYYTQRDRWLEDDDISVNAPLIIQADEWHPGGSTSSRFRQPRYYFWFFGFIAKLPYGRDIELPPLVGTRTHAST